MDGKQINDLSDRLLGREQRDQVEKFLEYGLVEQARTCLLHALVKGRVTNFSIQKACLEAGVSDDEAKNLIMALSTI